MTSRLIARLTFRSPPPVVGVIRLSGGLGQGGAQGLRAPRRDVADHDRHRQHPGDGDLETPSPHALYLAPVTVRSHRWMH